MNSPVPRWPRARKAPPRRRGYGREMDLVDSRSVRHAAAPPLTPRLAQVRRAIVVDMEQAAAAAELRRVILSPLPTPLTRAARARR